MNLGILRYIRTGVIIIIIVITMGIMHDLSKSLI